MNRLFPSTIQGFAIVAMLALIGVGCTTNAGSAGDGVASATSMSPVTKRGIHGLKKKAEIEAQLMSKQAALVQFAKDSGYADATRSPNGGVFGQEIWSRLDRLLAEAMRLYEEVNTLVTNLEKKTPEELLKAFSQEYSDGMMVRLIEQLGQAELQLKKLLMDLPQDSANILRASALVTKTKSQIDARSEAILAGLKLKLETAKTRADTMQFGYEKLRKEDAERVARALHYSEVLQEIKSLQQKRDNLELEIMEAEALIVKKP